MAEKTTPRKRPFEKMIPEEAIEHAKTARAEIRKSFQAFMPPEFVAHHRTARVEMLKAMRAVMDSVIERVESKE